MLPPSVMTGLTRFCLVFFVAASAWQPGWGQEWTRFRGPNGTGVSPAKGIPTTWTQNEIGWKSPLPGPGHSSPVVWGDKVFVTSGNSDGTTIEVLALRVTDGHILWKTPFPLARYSKNSNNSVASGSPAVDEKRVYVCWGTPAKLTLAALTHEGRLVWEKDLGPFTGQHGGGISPIVYRDRVVLANEQEAESYLLALDAATGETRWKTSREKTQASYSTPCVYEVAGRPPALLFQSQMHGFSTVNPEDGKVIWEHRDLFDKRTVGSPIVAGGLIVGACGNGGGVNYVVAVRPGDPAQGRKPELAYTLKRSAPYVPTSLSVGERLFLWSDAGIVSCVQAASGQVVWQERVGGNFFSSPIWVEGRLFGVSTKGEVVVLEAGDRFQVLARNALGETTHSTPAVAGGRMFIHTIKSLICVAPSTPH